MGQQVHRYSVSFNPSHLFAHPTKSDILLAYDDSPSARKVCHSFITGLNMFKVMNILSSIGSTVGQYIFRSSLHFIDTIVYVLSSSNFGCQLTLVSAGRLSKKTSRTSSGTAGDS